MFDFSWLSWLGFGGVGAVAIYAVAAYFLGAKAVTEAVAPVLGTILKFLADAFVGGMKLLWKGLVGLFETVSDIFTVMVIVAATWYATALHYRLEIKDIQFTHAQEISRLSKKPIQKPKTEGNGQFPFDFFR